MNKFAELVTCVVAFDVLLIAASGLIALTDITPPVIDAALMVTAGTMLGMAVALIGFAVKQWRAAA